MNHSLHLLPADDDEDDRELFQSALKELPVVIQLTTVEDGEALMQWLQTQKPNLPDLLFLDLNMPRKDGQECLRQIKQGPELQTLPVIILSAAVSPAQTDTLYATGAWYFIQKPERYGQLTKVVEQVLHLSGQAPRQQPGKKDFVLYSLSNRNPAF